MIDGWFYINFIINKFRKIPLFMKLISAYFTVFLCLICMTILIILQYLAMFRVFTRKAIFFCVGIHCHLYSVKPVPSLPPPPTPPPPPRTATATARAHNKQLVCVASSSMHCITQKSGLKMLFSFQRTAPQDFLSMFFGTDLTWGHGLH